MLSFLWSNALWNQILYLDWGCWDRRRLQRFVLTIRYLSHSNLYFLQTTVLTFLVIAMQPRLHLNTNSLTWLHSTSLSLYLILYLSYLSFHHYILPDFLYFGQVKPLLDFNLTEYFYSIYWVFYSVELLSFEAATDLLHHLI